MPKRLTASSTLESLRKEAKRRLKRLRAFDPAASLRSAQHAVANDYGFDGWAALRQALADLAVGRLAPGARADAFLRHCAWDGDVAGGLRILSRHPGIARHDLLTAIVCGEADEVERRLARDPAAARRPAGPLGWEPLLYLAYGRADASRAVRIAEWLLDLGADPDASFDDGWGNAFTVLCGVIGLGERNRPPHPQADALAGLLLARGAQAFDSQALYNSSVAGDDVRWLEVLWRACEARGELERWRAPSTGLGAQMGVNPLDYLLGNAVSYGHPRRIEWLVAHGADPDGIHSYTRLKLHTLVRARGDEATAALLERLGARPERLEGGLALLAASMRLDRSETERLIGRKPGLIEQAGALANAAARGRADVVALLLELGARADHADPQGNTALHHAAWSGSVETARLLVEAGAPVDRRSLPHHATALGNAVFARRREMVDYLETVSRDAADLAWAGRPERLRQVLAEEPERANDRRPSGTTPLHALPDDEALAAEIAQILLEHGADPAARGREGLTPAQAARARGLEEAAELIEAAAA